jgi:hypothetical protein
MPPPVLGKKELDRIFAKVRLKRRRLYGASDNESETDSIMSDFFEDLHEVSSSLSVGDMDMTKFSTDIQQLLYEVEDIETHAGLKKAETLLSDVVREQNIKAGGKNESANDGSPSNREGILPANQVCLICQKPLFRRGLFSAQKKHCFTAQISF